MARLVLPPRRVPVCGGLQRRRPRRHRGVHQRHHQRCLRRPLRWHPVHALHPLARLLRPTPRNHPLKGADMAARRRLVRVVVAALLASLAPMVSPGTPAAADPPVPVEAEQLLPPVSATAPVAAQANCCGVSWSAGQQLWFRATQPGDQVTVTLPAVPPGQYDLGAVLTQAPDYGTLRFAIDGVAIGQLFDGYADHVRRTGAVPLGSAMLSGTHQLTVTVTGRNPASTGFFAGLDTITLRRVGPTVAVSHTPYETVAATPVAGELVRVYDPSVGETETWYYNDHSLIRDPSTGLWHVFAITHAEPAAPQDERMFGHATAPHPTGPWTKQPPALWADPAAGEHW